MAAEQIELRTTVFTKGHGWLNSYGTNLRDSILRLGRTRWTAGETVLAQADCERGALHARPDGALWFLRLDGTATSDDATREDLFAPIRSIWHYNDRNGAPETDGRSIAGDLIIWDDGTNDRFLGVCTGSGVYGLGVRADYRTAATALSTTQNSDAVAWRSSRWVTSAAKYRQWRAVARGDASDANNSFLSLYAKREEGSEYKIFDFQHLAGSNSKFYVYGDGVGSVPGIGFTADPAGVSPGSISCVFGPNGTDIDGTAVWFKHGDSTRHVRWRFFGVDDETTGTGAEVLAVTYQQAASGGETTKRSPSFVHRGAAWSGAASVEVAAYSQLVPTSTTAGYLETGFDFGSGVYQFHHDGLLGIAGSSTGGLLLSRYTAATNGSQLVDSSLLKFRGAYWNGAASADLDATTKLVTDATTPTAHLRSTFSSGVAIFDHYDDGAAVFHMDPAGASTYGGQLAIRPDTTSNASNPAIDSPAFSAVAYSGSLGAARVIGLYTQIDSSADASDQWSARFLAVGTGSAEVLGIRSTGELVVADIAGHALEFATALGTHNKTTNADKTGNAKSGTIKVKANGTTYHIQLYADA